MTIKNGFLGMLIALGFMWVKGEKKKHWSVPDEPSDVPFVFPYQPAPAFKFPVFIAEPVDKEPEVLHTKKMYSGFYPLRYLGPKRDTISCKHFIFEKSDTNVDYAEASPRTMAIQVDTSASFPYMCYQTNEKILKTHPVYIFTKGLKPVRAGSSVTFPFILEAKDQNGRWKPIEYSFPIMCGVGVSNLLVFPGEIAATVVKIYSGPYKTRMRLRMKYDHLELPYPIYSNEFNGSMEPSQFKNTSGF